MTTPPAIHLEQASLAYNNIPLFNELNITLAAGKWSAILGPSGVGKSTLLRVIAQLLSKEVGLSASVYCNNAIPLAENIAYMAQTDLLMPWLTALDNTLLSARLTGQPVAVLRERAIDLLGQVGLSQSLHHYPNELSGGMRQRVALVRTLIQDKPIVLMDEPFSALDAITRFQLQSLAAKLLNHHTVLLVTHDPLEALRLCHDIYILSGQPATLNTFLTLSTPTPREPSDPDFMTHQAALFQALLQAKEVSH